MTGTSSNRLARWALVGIALVAFGLRALPFFGPEGAWTYRVDYDEGVYFSAASYLLQGVLPWRDFVFVHPPGLLFFLAATSAWTHAFLGVDGAFTFARWLAVLIGVLNTVLVARIVSRWNGPAWASLLAAGFYATYSEIVQSERGPFLEPLLNLVCLGLVLALLHAQASPRRGRWLAFAGVLGGFALTIKLWAVVWVVGALWALASFTTRRELLHFALTVAGTALLLVGPLALLAPEAFFTQVALFHAWRPPDSFIARGDRLTQIVSVRHLASPLLAALTVALLAWKRQWSPLARISVAAWALTLLAFFASAAWWNQYNAHLIASEALVAGGLFSLLPSRLRGALALASVLSIGLSISHTVRRSQPTTEHHLSLVRSTLRDSKDCVFTFEPGWSLAAGRLPARETGPLIDNYAVQLLNALQGGTRHFTTTSEAFSANKVIPVGLTHCRYLVMGERGNRELDLERLSLTHVDTEFEGLAVWELRAPAR